MTREKRKLTALEQLIKLQTNLEINSLKTFRKKFAGQKENSIPLLTTNSVDSSIIKDQKSSHKWDFLGRKISFLQCGDFTSVLYCFTLVYS